MNEFDTAIIFLIGLFISAIIIYLITRLFGESKGIFRAIITALIGTIVYTAAYDIIETGWMAAIAAGIVWLFALVFLYKMGFLKSLIVAVAIWICATMVGVMLPTVSGPL